MLEAANDFLKKLTWCSRFGKTKKFELLSVQLLDKFVEEGNDILDQIKQTTKMLRPLVKSNE